MRSYQEGNLERTAKLVQNLLKFKHFYEQMDFRPEHKMAITKSVIELSDPSESCGLVEKRQRKADKTY